MVTVLIAYGPNNIQIPCRIFKNMKEATNFCDPLFSQVNCAPQMLKTGEILYNADLDEIENEPISEVLFTKHYYGCGGAYRFVLKNVAFNEKFVCFNLD